MGESPAEAGTSSGLKLGRTQNTWSLEVDGPGLESLTCRVQTNRLGAGAGNREQHRPVSEGCYWGGPTNGCR